MRIHTHNAHLYAHGRLVALSQVVLIISRPPGDDSKADLFLGLCRQRPDWPINRLVRTLTDGSTYISHRSSRILSVLLLYAPQT